MLFSGDANDDIKEDRHDAMNGKIWAWTAESIALTVQIVRTGPRFFMIDIGSTLARGRKKVRW